MTKATLTDIAGELANLGSQLRQITVKVRSGFQTVGSGVIWRPLAAFAGRLIITNAHVATSSRVSVELADGREFPAVRTKIDPELDLAALKIAAIDIPAATIGQAEVLRVGELVIAVGNPFADKNAVSCGIVVTKHKQTLVTDIRLFPGYSGGPVANCLGRVVGINSMIVNGLGVAISSSTVEGFLSSENRPPLQRRQLLYRKR